MHLQRPDSSGRKAILLVALGVAALMGVVLFLWVRSSPPPSREIDVEGLLSPGDAEYTKYRGLVTLQTGKISVARNYVGTRVVRVAGKIYNGSDRLLEAVRVQITLRSGDQAVLKQTRFPISPGRTRPIAPQESFDFTLWIEQIPQEWDGGSADVEISGLKLGRTSG